MKLHFIGTGHGAAINCYNACFAIEDNGEYFLVDSGGGSQLMVNLDRLNIPVDKINNVFISHKHIDHIFGVIWYIRTVGRMYFKDDTKPPVTIYGHDEVIQTIKTLSSAVLPEKILNMFGDKIILKEVKNEEEAEILSYKVTFFDTTARKVKQFGFYLEDEAGFKLSFLGDEYCKEESKKYIQNSRILVSDGYMCGKEAEEYDPIGKHAHSTVKYASTVAEECNVKNLILFHTIDTDMANRKKTFTEDAKLYFKGNVYVPEDLETLEF